MRTQPVLMRAADRIDAVIAPSGPSGFAGMELSVPDREIRLHWKGPLTEAVATELDTLRASGLGIVVVEAQHSRSELESVAASFREREHDGRLTSISIPQDGGGIDIGSTDPDVARELRTDTADVPVRFRREKRQPPYRTDDAAPLSAGGAIQPFNASGCGSGFSAWGWRFIPPDVFTRRFYTFAAHHCGGTVGEVVFAGSGPSIGTVEAALPNLDSLAVRTLDRTLPRMYDGGRADGTWFFKPVVGLGTNRVGLYTCMSGLRGGTRCGLKIVETGKSVYQDDHWVTNLVVAEQVERQIAAVAGDSGSPVFALDESLGKVIALGILYGPEQPFDPCPIGGRCAWSVRYVDLRAVLGTYRLQLTVASDDVAWPGALSLRAYPGNRSRYVLADSAMFATVVTPASEEERLSATFWIMPPRVSGPNRVSLQAVGRPGFYLVNEARRIRFSRERNNQEFDASATFVFHPGRGAADGRSLEPLNSLGSFVHVETPSTNVTPQPFPAPLPQLWATPPGVWALETPRGQPQPTLDGWNRTATFFTAPPQWDFR